MNRPEILIIDNNQHHRSTLIRILSPLKPAIFQASDIQEGIAIATAKKTDLIISNIRITDRNGSDLWHQLNNILSSRQIPVLFLGTDPQEQVALPRDVNGINAYIEKKEAKIRLLDIAQKLLSDSKRKRCKQILLVDDSKAIREMLQEGLLKEGYQVLTAINGKVALKILETEVPDLILSDVYMPVMDGFTLCKTIRSDPQLSQIPFVVMSTENDAANMKRMMQYGAASFIVKPFNFEQLMMILNNIFSFQFSLLLKEKQRLDMEKKLIISSISSLVNALEARDAYTRGHSERVARMLADIVKFAGGSQDEIDRVFIGGKLHDIGKIGIRDNILLKTDQLTTEEFEQIKTHPVIGETILESIESLSDIIPIVASHHERIDGRGYPQGLKGTQIPLWARMTAVVDTYDALTSDRPYRKGMNSKKAMEIIHEVKGTQLCSESVELFLNHQNSLAQKKIV